jgi:gas vesicle protein
MAQTDAGTGDQVKEKATEVAGQAQEKAQQAAGQARDQVRSQIDQRSTDAGQKVSAQGSDLRAVGDQLREQGKDGPAKLADQAANHVERAGSWLSESDADKILHDLEDAARKNPWAVVAGGVALGFAASRVLKASSSDRYQARSGGTPSGRPALPRVAGPDEPRFVSNGEFADTLTPQERATGMPSTGMPSTGAI